VVGRFSFADRSRVVFWFSSHVAQLSTLGHFRVFDFDRAGLAGDDYRQKHFDE
jgi:hypothetical protein